MKVGACWNSSGVQCGTLLAVLAALMLTAACDAPGKPHAEETLPENSTDFAVLYGSNCAGCHSVDGKRGPGRPINDPLYLAIIPKDELRKVIVYGRKGTAMPAWAKSQGGPLSDQQVNIVVDGIEKNWAKPVTPPLVNPPSYVATSAGDPAAGKQLFQRDCNICHGPGMRVGSVSDPVYLSLASNQLIRSSIIEGWPIMGMPNYRRLNLGRELSDANITDIVAYLASLRPNQANVQGLHTDENGGPSASMVKGNEGSGNGGDRKGTREGEGNKVGGQSQGGGVK